MVDGVTIPQVPSDRTHVYYQYCPYVPESETIVKRCIRRGVDVAPMHVDVCTQMELFGWQGPPAPGAIRASKAVQLPMYESLQDAEVERVGRLVRTQVERLSVGILEYPDRLGLERELFSLQRLAHLQQGASGVFADRRRCRLSRLSESGDAASDCARSQADENISKSSFHAYLPAECRYVIAAAAGLAVSLRGDRLIAKNLNRVRF